MNKSVYIAGPMRGVKDFNFPAFFEAEQWLRSWGYLVFNPARRDVHRHGADMFVGDGSEADAAACGFNLREALCADLEFITKTADMVVTLPGWESSRGANAEVATAIALDIPVVPLAELQDDATSGYVSYRAVEVKPDQDQSEAFLTRHPDLREPLMVSREAKVEVVDGRPVLFPHSFVDIKTEESNEPIARVNTRTGETMTVSSSGAMKGSKLARYDLIPVDALTEVAEHYGRTAGKYPPNNWRAGYEWSKSYAALLRHVTQWWNGEDKDEELDTPHLAAVAWHALTLLNFSKHHPEFDDRPKV